MGENFATEYPDGVSLDFLGLLEPEEALPLLQKRRECLADRCSALDSYSDDIRTSHPGLNILILQAQLEYEMTTKLIDTVKRKVT